MTRTDALQDLSSDSAHRRLAAARFLRRNVLPSDLDALRAALRAETVSYVRNCLQIAIKRASHSVPPRTTSRAEEYTIPPDLRAQIKDEAIEEIASLILHEIASPVGLIATVAAREIPEYEKSQTKRHIEHLRRLFKAIEQLKDASAVPRPEEFDLAKLIADVVQTETQERQVEVSLHGVKPMLITSDPTLLRLSISNGVRNSVEAVFGTTPSEPHSIVITWGETDVDYWAAILDRGPGVVGAAESAFDIGKTTKRGHSGFGLTIARQAIETLGGSCTLQPGAHGGARFEVRWER